MTVKETPSGQMQMPLLITFAKPQKIRVPSSFAPENVCRTRRETQTVVKKTRAQEFNQAWESLGFTKDSIKALLNRLCTHSQLCTGWCQNSGLTRVLICRQ